MTKERAFEILNRFPRCAGGCDELPIKITCDECDDAFYTALKALKEPEIVRCKDCVHRGDSKKCILAFVSEKQNFPLFFYDNRGEWFCRDGRREESDPDD